MNISMVILIKQKIIVGIQIYNFSIVRTEYNLQFTIVKQWRFVFLCELFLILPLSQELFQQKSLSQYENEGAAVFSVLTQKYVFRFRNSIPTI